ncbi:MAG: PTS sugar transporter subunit IIA [Treponema sp.]|nr:PTS sugar transporter subunit IIA [Treponema sp.]
MLKEFILDNEAFALGVLAESWQTAVKCATDILVSTGAAEPRYFDAIVQMTEEHGPYYVVAPGIAMPHARPESGARKTGFALLTLQKPVCFGHADNDPVDIILCICAANAADLNETAIIEAMTLFDDEAALEKLRTVKTKDELRTVLAACSTTW